MLHNIGSPYRTPAVRFFQRKNARNKKREKGHIEEKERETETFKVFQGITRKSYHRKRISPHFYSHRQEVPESRGRSFELPSRTYLFSSVIRTAWISAPLPSPPIQDRRKAIQPKNYEFMHRFRVDVYGERNNARAHIGQSRGATTSSSPCTYLRHENCHGRSQTFLLK